MTDNRRFNFSVRAATNWERTLIERAEGPLASDHCVLCTYDDLLLGWADDYGTFHPLTLIGRHAAALTEDVIASVVELAAAVG